MQSAAPRASCDDRRRSGSLFYSYYSFISARKHTLVPDPGDDTTDTWPPINSALSRMVRIPMPPFLERAGSNPMPLSVISISRYLFLHRKNTLTLFVCACL